MEWGSGPRPCPGIRQTQVWHGVPRHYLVCHQASNGAEFFARVVVNMGASTFARAGQRQTGTTGNDASERAADELDAGPGRAHGAQEHDRKVQSRSLRVAWRGRFAPCASLVVPQSAAARCEPPCWQPAPCVGIQLQDTPSCLTRCSRADAENQRSHGHAS